jgi:hypothetical protein
MTDVTYNISAELYNALSEGTLQTFEFLNKILFKATDKNIYPAELTDPLLALHVNEGGHPDIINLQLLETEYDPQTGLGKVLIGYILGYSNTCAGTRNDLTKKERVNFKVDKNKHTITLSFFDQISA